MKVADSMKGAQPMARRNPLERFNRGTVTTRCVRDRLSYSAGPPDETAGPQTKIVATIGPASNRRRPSNA
jgi:hypothetical protein